MDNEPSSNDHFKKHFQKLYLDYEHLQREYGKLRKKFTEHQIKSKTSSTSVSDSNQAQTSISEDLEREKLVTKSLNAEIATLVKDRKLLESRYSELVAIVSSQKTQAEDNARLKELENEIKELKETLDFVTSENAVLKDIEERVFQERLEWVKEKEEYKQVVVWSKHINDKLKEQKVINEVYEKLNDSFNKFLIFLFDYCCQRLPQSHNSQLANTDTTDTSDDLIENFKKCLDQDEEDKNNKNHNNFEKKMEIVEKLLKLISSTPADVVNSCPLLLPNHKNNDNQQDLANNNKNDNIPDYNSKTKIANLYKENAQLKEQNTCLTIEVNELKSILNKRHVSTEEIDLKLENAKLSERLKLKEEMLTKLGEKFARNRQVLEENYKRSTDEIKALDNFIAIILGKLNGLSNDLKENPQLKELLTIINENDNTEQPQPPTSSTEHKQ